MEDGDGSDERVTRLVDHPLAAYDGAPNGELTQTYSNEGWLEQGQLQLLKEFYTTWSNGEKSPKTRFTCVFTCPNTGEHFAAGNWKNKKGVTIVDGTHWYNTKKIALQAAAAKALDCFSLRRCHGTEKHPSQRCVDLPYLIGDAPALPDLPPDVTLPPPLSPTPRGEGGHVASLIPPKQALKEWDDSFFKKLNDVGIVLKSLEDEGVQRRERYSCWSNRKESPDTLFTAVYTCHLSGERFPSGRLFGQEDAYEEHDWYYCQPDDTPDLLNDDGGDEDVAHDGNDVDHPGYQSIKLVWYKTKKEAEIAAAGRAVDCLKLRDAFQEEIPAERYCREVPYRLEDSPDASRLLSELLRVNEVWLSTVPFEERVTTQFGISHLQELLDEREEYWHARYIETRRSTTRSDAVP
jgi:hypothetical protein